MKKITLHQLHGIILCLIIQFSFINLLCSQSPYAPDEMIIRFQPGTSEIYIDSLMLLYNATEDPAISPTEETGFHLWTVQLDPSSREMSFSTINEVINDARSRAKVNSAGLNYESKVVPEESEGDTVAQVFDPAYYYPADSFSVTCPVSNQSVRVGILDTGVDFSLDATGNPVFGTDSLFSPFYGSNIGYDFVNNDTLPQDDHGHGTHISGTVAGIGFHAGYFSLQLHAYKTHDENGFGELFDIIRAIDNAIHNNIQILNMSFSYQAPPPSQKPEPVEEAINLAANSGILIIAAAGNNSHDNDTISYPSYPASFSCGNLISVSSIDTLGDLSGFSNWGAGSVDIAAPGEIIIAPDLTDTIVAKDGSSQATAVVSGVASLLASNQSAFQYSEIICSIAQGAQQDAGLYLKNASSGFIDAMGAFNQLMQGICNPNREEEPGSMKPNSGRDILVYPNPFRQDFVIGFEVDRPEKVSIRLIDALGRTIAGMQENVLEGAHEVAVQIPNAGGRKGIFYAQIRIGNELVTKKVVKE